MNERVGPIEIQPSSDLARISDISYSLLSEFAEESWDVFHDISRVTWKDPKETINVRIERVFSYEGHGTWVHCGMYVLPQYVDGVKTQGSSKLLAFATKKTEQAKVPTAILTESDELRWGSDGWEPWGERATRVPSEYDIAEFEVYLAMVQQDKERRSRYRRQKGSRDLGAYATRELALKTSEFDFFKGDFSS